MKILLIGEYSNLHCTLARALKREGHEVVLISNGDNWKNYSRDIDIRRRSHSIWGSFCYLWRIISLLPRMRGYDVVQLINPVFIDMKPRWNRWLFDYLQRNNRALSLGLFGDDYQVVKATSQSGLLAYTDFIVGNTPIVHHNNDERRREWILSPKAELCQYISQKADFLISCLYEYHKAYDFPEFRSRLFYAPLPIVPQKTIRHKDFFSPQHKVKILIGIQSKRAAMKGSDRMLPLFERLAQQYPDRIELTCVDSVPFEQYVKMVESTDILVDQLYSYTPAMNALEAMSHGVIVVSGGEEEAYEFIEEKELRPIINLRPMDDEANYRLLEQIICSPERLQRMSEQSIQFILKHHEASQVAHRYLQIWQNN